MDNLEKNDQLNALFSIYKDLLTEKQQAYFESYYVNDYSFSEIATFFEVSRNAVFDQLKKASEHLLNYESKLHLLENRLKRQAYMDKYLSTNASEWLMKIKEMDDN